MPDEIPRDELCSHPNRFFIVLPVGHVLQGLLCSTLMVSPEGEMEFCNAKADFLETPRAWEWGDGTPKLNTYCGDHVPLGVRCEFVALDWTLDATI